MICKYIYLFIYYYYAKLAYILERLVLSVQANFFIFYFIKLNYCL